MDALLLVLDTGLMIFLCSWAIANDAAGSSGMPSGFFAYRSEQAPPPGQERQNVRRHGNRW